MSGITRHSFRYLAGFALAISILLGMFFVLRVLLYLDNIEFASSASTSELIDTFLLGARFDLRICVYACIPLIFIGLTTSEGYKTFSHYWLTLFSTGFLLLGVMEIEFYGEFQQRLNGLVFQYIKEDFSTVMTMIWYGLPVVTYTVVWLVGSWLLWFLFKLMLDRVYGKREGKAGLNYIPIVVVLILLTIMLGRGTLRSGPPLRWGDAFHSDHMFLNHLALNGTFTLAKAVIYKNEMNPNSKWLKALPENEAVSVTRKMILTKSDQLVDLDDAPIRRIHASSRDPANAYPQNIVVILMESYSGQFVGALGNKQGVTPEFDALAKEGVLFSHFFSNGTHTHQGIFATLSCFPNLPGYEYLMQQPEGRSHFSGLARLLPEHESLFVYNGDFSWDNQAGYFRNQGLKRFVGRYDYENPIFEDPVWGVSDEDMFSRGAEEWQELANEPEQPFLLILQSLSNHLPYNLPEPLAFKPITDQGELSQRLTAMKYSDWALGQFFRKIRETEQFSNTLFVIVGDHGFGVEEQLTEINLLRFHVPMLLIGPGLQKRFGNRIDTIGSQVDIVPTVAGLLGKSVQHQCWGRNLFDLSKGDGGLAMIKPSGDESIVAILRDKNILTYDHQRGSNLYRMQLYPEPDVQILADKEMETKMQRQLESFVQAAMNSLISNSTSDKIRQM